MTTAPPEPTILIVDDNAVNLDVLTGYLRGYGFQLMVARNGRDGIEKAKLGRPDLILLDVMMPDIDGFETCRRLQADPATAEIPVIFITALQSVEDKVKGFTAGAVDYITKPLQEEEVLARVRTHVQLQQQKKQLLQEIAERKAAEETIHQHHEFLTQVLDSLSHPFYVIDVQDYGIVMANSAARELGEDGIATCYALTHKTDRPCDNSSHPCPLALIRQTKTSAHLEHVHRDRHGRPRYVEVHGFPLFNRDGELTQMIEYSFDITERKQMEAEIIAAKEAALEAQRRAEGAQQAAEAANRAKSVFLATMNHELRSPLNAILGFAQVMAHSGALSPEHREFLEIISRSGDHLLTLINQVLDFSKVEAGRMTADLADIDLHRLFDEVAGLFRLRAEEKGLTLTCTRDPGVPRRIRTDAVKLRQIVINLIGNAVKFTAAGGVTVQVDAGQSPPHAPRITLQFSITDTGPGIAPEELARVFEPFVQADAGRRTQEGTGLGLPLSRKFAALLGGDLTVDSVVGRGTTFVLTFPCDIAGGPASAAAPPIQPQVRALAPGEPRYRVLIADDQPEARRLLTAWLTPVGFSVREAADGRDALDLWRAWEPDVILMDICMPAMDGWAAARAIRQAEAQRADDAEPVTILAVTADASGDEAELARAAGCDDLLSKPLREDALFAVIQRHLGLCYLYADDVPPPEPVRLDADALDSLPDNARQRLYEAVNTADVESANAVIARIRLNNAPLADALADLVAKYRFDTLLALFARNSQESRRTTV